MHAVTRHESCARRAPFARCEAYVRPFWARSQRVACLSFRGRDRCMCLIWFPLPHAWQGIKEDTFGFLAFPLSFQICVAPKNLAWAWHDPSGEPFKPRLAHHSKASEAGAFIGILAHSRDSAEIAPVIPCRFAGVNMSLGVQANCSCYVEHSNFRDFWFGTPGTRKQCCGRGGPTRNWPQFALTVAGHATQQTQRYLCGRLRSLSKDIGASAGSVRLRRLAPSSACLTCRRRT